jgi:hypothetical protein
MNKKFFFAAAVPLAASCTLLAQAAFASPPPPIPACPPTPAARCIATADLHDFNDKIRVTHQSTLPPPPVAAPAPTPAGYDLLFQVVAPDGQTLGCPVPVGVGENVSVTLKIKEIYNLAQVPAHSRLSPNVVQVIETQDADPHDMQGTITYGKNGLVTPLIFTCESAVD